MMDKVEVQEIRGSGDTPLDNARQNHASSILAAFDLHGRSALITGGHGALAETMARTLAELGCSVALAARNDQHCVDLAEAICAAYPVRVIGLRCDVTNEEEVESAVDTTVERLGSLDILITNAGAFWYGPPEEVPLRGWKRAIDVNLTGAFLACRTAARHMIKAGHGSIINIASSGGVNSFPPEIGELVPYTTAKGAVIKLTRDLALSWARHGIRVNSLAPGFMESTFTVAVNDQRKERLLARSPFGRFAYPSDMAGAIAFLASDASGFMTGQTLIVDGGETIG